ncbi:MAG TPA: hypothetical protein VFG13_14165 [Blastococcus sp.]|nr:hypothetical protein [Blastococcus sp.]
MLSADEQQAWQDIVSYYDLAADEPARVREHPAYRRRRPALGVDELPTAAVAGVWISILLILVGAVAGGLAVAVATALGWALWRWWPVLGSGSAPGSSTDAGAEEAGEPSIMSWQRRLRRMP